MPVVKRTDIGSRLYNSVCEALGGKFSSCRFGQMMRAIDQLKLELVHSKRDEMLQVIYDNRHELSRDTPDSLLDSVITLPKLHQWYDTAIQDNVLARLKKRDTQEDTFFEEEKVGYYGVGSFLEDTFTALGIKSCASCKRRKNKINRVQKKIMDRIFGKKLDAPRLQFVWCYFHRAAKQDELRFSMRSVEKHFQGEASFLVIGDKPPWYDGPFIDCPRIRKGKGFRRGLHDVQHKMWTLSNDALVEQEFVWMMDDIFMVQLTNVKDLMTPRAAGKIGQSRMNGWQTVKTNTGNRLREGGFPARDYATHLPHFVQKEKLKVLFELWDPLKETFLWEVAYHNLHRHEPAKHAPFLRRVKAERSPEWYDRISTQSHFLNIYNNGWGADLRNWLIDQFPNRHEGEEKEDVEKYYELKEQPELEQQFIIIQSAYKDADFSKERMELTREWCLPSLQAQTTKVNLQISVCIEDPHLEERKEMFRSSGHDVKFIYKDPANIPMTMDTLVDNDPWEIPVGPRTAVSRMDDDDAISIDFLTLVKERANLCKWSKAVLEWTNGYTLVNKRLYKSHRPGNQFITILSNEGTNPHKILHWRFPNLLPTVRVNGSRGWVWVRHEKTLSKTREQHTQGRASPPNRDRWNVTLP
jgi:hypothetical protein|tara:strand:- start:1421 stop:3337 length:1917 start_codon:yes stop_codon:yes gene_type:complete